MGWHNGANVGRLGWLQPVESDNIAFLLMPHCRPSPRELELVATFFPKRNRYYHRDY